MLLMAENGKPVVSGPAYTAGASAMKSESFSPSSGTMPCASAQNMVALPCEWPIKAICAS